MIDYSEISNSDIEKAINDYVHNEKIRQMLKRRLIDGLTFEMLAEEFDMTPRGAKKAVYKYGDKVLLKIK